MNPKFKNNKVSRSLQAILAGSDEEVKNEAGVSEMVAKSEEEKPVEEEVKEEKKEDEEVKDDEKSEEAEEETEEISEEEVESAKKEDEDEEEPEEVEEVEEEEVSEDEDEDEDEEPIAEEEIEEITDDEVEAAKKEMEDDDEEPEEIIDEDEEVAPEEQPIEEVMDEENTAEDEEEPDEDATTEAVASLVKAGFVCSLDGKGKICVTACGEPAEACDCGSEECPECNPKKEEEACVTLNPVTDEDKVEAEDVTCVQSGTEEKPFYTVLIKGMPTATICLEDQPNAEAIRGYFLSADYPRKLASAMAKGGVKNVLDTQKARMFTAMAEKSALAQAMKAEAKAEFDKQIAEAVTKMAEKFANSVKLAVAGMNKNFFTEDNDLKAATYAAFTELGCNEDVAYDKVNKVFAQADKYFDTVIAKAQELMGKSDEAFAEVAEMVANAGVASKPAKTFASALADGNNPVIAGMMQTQQKVEAKSESKIRTMRMFR